MPVPMLTKHMTSFERSQTIKKLEDWCKSVDANETKSKAMVLQKVIEESNKILPPSRFRFIYNDPVNGADNQVYDSIFRNTDLPELLFLQHVINQINSISSGDHPLRVEVLPLAVNQLNMMIIPIIHEIRNAAIVLGCFSIFMRFNIGLLLSAVGGICSEKLAYWRIARALDNALALKEMGGKVPRVEDGYDNVAGAISKLASSSYSTASHFFHKMVLPMVMSEQKEASQSLLNK